MLDHALEHVTDVLLGQEGSLDINLGELGLAICTQVFIAEALGDLVVAVKAGHHEQLLEQLRRLRQGKKLAIVNPTGDQIVASPLGRALGEHGGFDVDKTVFVQVFAHLHGHFVAQHEVVLHVGATQVQHPMGQASGLRQVLVVEQKRRGNRGVEHRQFVAQDFDLAAAQTVVGGALGACTHQTLDLHAKLVAQAFGSLEHFGAVGITHHLHITLAVAQVDKNDASVVTATVDPTAQLDGLAHQGFGHQTAIMSTHGHLVSRWLEAQGRKNHGEVGADPDRSSTRSSGTTAPMEMM